MPDEDDDPVYEVTRMVTASVRAVNRPASGFRWAFLKSSDDGKPMTESQAAALAAKRNGERLFGKSADDKVTCPTCDGDGTILQGNRQCPDCGGDGKVSQDKADDLAKSLFEMMAKAAGVLAADLIVELPEGADVANTGVMLDPTSNAALFVKAQFEYGQFVKAKYSADDLKDMASKGQAMKNEAGDPSYPIKDEEDLDNAIHAVGRGSGDHDAIRAHIIARAKALKLTSKIPDNWNADGSMAKALGDDGTNQGVPGSSAWEAQDAAALRTIALQLVGLKEAIEQSAEREAIEGNTVDPDDTYQSWDLQDAAYCLDGLLGVIAAIAFKEQQESMNAASRETAEMTKAAESLLEQARASGAEPLVKAATEALTQISMVKAGARLSSATKGAIKAGIASAANVHQTLTDLLGEDEKSPDGEEDDDMNKAEVEAILDEKLAARDESLLKSIGELFAGAGKPSGEPTGEGDPIIKAGDGAGASGEVTPAEPMVKSTDVLVSEAVAEAVKPLDEKLDGFIKAMNDWGNAPRGSRPALSELVTRAVPRSDPAGSATPGSPAAIVGALEEQFAKSTDPIAKSRIGEQLTLARMKAAGMDPQRPIAVGSGS